MPRCEGMPVPEFDTKNPPQRRVTKAPKAGYRVKFAFLVGDEVYDCTAAEAAELDREAAKTDPVIMVADPTKESVAAEHLLKVDTELMELRAKAARMENEAIALQKRNLSLQDRVTELEDKNRELRSLVTGSKQQSVSTTLPDPSVIAEQGARNGSGQSQRGR